MRSAIEDADDVFFSAVTAWEMATKVRLRKRPTAEPYLARLADVIERFTFQPLPITVEDGLLAGLIASPHKDPFDRILAQAQRGDMLMATAYKAFGSLGVRTLW